MPTTNKNTKVNIKDTNGTSYYIRHIVRSKLIKFKLALKILHLQHK